MNNDNKVKLAIITRFYCYDMDRDCTALTNNPQKVDYYARLSSITIARSLRNQSDSDFEHYTITNDRADSELMKHYQEVVGDAGLNTTLVSYSEYNDLLKSLHKGPVCLSKMDLDDLVHSRAVEYAKEAYVPGRLIVHGYQKGLRYDLTTGGCEVFSPNYKNIGHILLMQSFVFDDNARDYDPYEVSHVDVYGSLKKVGDKFADASLIVYGDEKCGKVPPYVYIRHHGAWGGYTILRPVASGNFPSDVIAPEQFSSYYGISPSELQEKFNEIRGLV